MRRANANGGSDVVEKVTPKPSVRMLRPTGEHVRSALLDGQAVLHDEDTVAEVADHPEVVRDEEVAEPGRALQRDEQVEDLGLDGDVECGHRLVEHDHRGP